MSGYVSEVDRRIGCDERTFTLRCGLQSKVDKLELVDLVGKLEYEDLVELKPSRGATGVVEELDQLIRELVPQLALP